MMTLEPRLDWEALVLGAGEVQEEPVVEAGGGKGWQQVQAGEVTKRIRREGKPARSD